MGRSCCRDYERADMARTLVGRALLGHDGSGAHGGSLLDILAQNLARIRDLLREDWDWLTCFDGYERVGKSTLALQTCLMIDPDFGIEKVVFDWEGLKEVLQEAPKHSAIFYDEARMLTRERLSRWNIAMMQALSIIGFRNQFMVFNFPDFWELDPYIKDHRCRTRGFVRTMNAQRGYAQFWASKKAPFKSKRGRSVWWEPAFSYTFTGMDDTPHYDLWKDYLRKERAAKTRLLENGTNSRDERIARALGFGMKQAAIAKYEGLSQQRISSLKKTLKVQT